MASPADTAKALQRLFSHMPGAFRQGKNFNALMGSIAQSDADLQNLFLEVKRQLFVQTAEGEYLDMLGSNVGVVRPALIGMVDDDFRDFIKLQTYFPKQIRQLLFRLMELFYGRDTIKANIRSTAFGPFAVFDGATLIINTDGLAETTVTFNSSNFSDPTNVSPEELAAEINSQVASTLFASTYLNAIDKQDFLEVFTNTYGPVGSIEIVGGSANRFLKFPNTMRLGTTISTLYRLEKQSTLMKLYWAGGNNPLFSQLRLNDSVILTGTPFSAANAGSFFIGAINDTGVPAIILSTTQAQLQSPNIVRYFMPSTSNIFVGNSITITGFVNSDNNGTFIVNAVSPTYIDVVSTRTTGAHDETHAGQVDLKPSASYISYENENGVDTATFGVTTVDDVLFFRPVKKKLESAQRPATVWEVNANEIIVTLPATPVVVRRGLAGSAHMQGTSAVVTSSFTNIVNVASNDFFPETQGHFYIQRPDGYIDRSTRYTYGALNGTQLLGVTPTVAAVGSLLQLGVGPLSATIGSNVVQVTTTEPHGLQSGEVLRFDDNSGFAGLTDDDLNGQFTVTNIIDDLNFTITVAHNASATTMNAPSVDKGKIFTTHGSKVVITNVQQGTGYAGSFVYDQTHAPYTISGTQTTITQDILLGAFGGSIAVFNSTVFPSDTGQVVINYGRQDEEGPINYIAKPGTSSMFLDPAYRFKKSHSAGAAINLLSSNFATVVGPTGAQLPVYVVDTISPRAKLEELLLDAKAAGVSVRFIVVLPDNVYNAFSLYG